jgi:predicted MFS family arabinose efflux permease
MAQPTSANPAATALALALGSIFAATRGRPGLAGALAGLTAFWRPDFGAVAAVAVLAVLIVRAQDPARTGRRSHAPRGARFSASAQRSWRSTARSSSRPECPRSGTG